MPSAHSQITFTCTVHFVYTEEYCSADIDIIFEVGNESYQLTHSKLLCIVP